MRRTSSQRGSALLIVLGMLSFMIISAVGFATYMRYARQPSSFLRRTVSTRQLTKAALAQAIDQIDQAIGNNPHPGVGGERASSKVPYNGWHHRIFTATNNTPNEALYDYTVSPLCLEALAYIPPPLVNEARYWSRLTPTAIWQPMSFDAGRFSWCAIDVSDYFDVNRMMADVPRSSAAGRRITLAHLFEGRGHRDVGSGADKWDGNEFMERFRGKQDKKTLTFDLKDEEPLISIADFNLALGAKGRIGELRSPFFDYVTKAGDGFYDFRGEAEKDIIRQMTFVTDSLQKPVSAMKTDKGEKIYDLADGENQPFKRSFLEDETPPLSDAMLKVTESPSDGWMKWQDRLSGLGRAALYDYLDPDHVPISLAIPTTERVPMFCGIQPEFAGAKWSMEKEFEHKNGDGSPKRSGDKDDEQVAKDGDTRDCRQTVYYRVHSDFRRGLMTGGVNALVCFPFNHDDSTDKPSFKADGRFSFFLTEGDVSLRTGNPDDPYHLSKMEIADTMLDASTGLINIKLGEQTVSFNADNIVRQQDAVKRIAHSFGSAEGKIGGELADNAFLRVDYMWTQKYEVKAVMQQLGAKGTWNPSWDDAVKNGKQTIEKAHCSLPATVWNNKRYGSVDEMMKSGNEKALAEFLQKGGSKTLTLRAAVWLRMKNAESKIVDMVPACLNDDETQNRVDDPYPLMKHIGNDRLGQANPLMLFNTGVTFDFSIAGLDDLVSKPQPIEISPKQAIVSDPRYNHAPEHWYKVAEDLTPENWLKQNNIGSSDSGRDNDIFMATSDSGYLQSHYEVAFLPRFSNLRNGGSETGAYERPDDPLLSEIPSSFGDTRNQGLVWRTFDPLEDNADAFTDLPWRNLGSGQTVNPYSDSTNVLMAAFANTPIDWKRASTNIAGKAEKFATMKASDFNQDYAFNEYAPKGQRLAWIDLEEIAGRFKDEVRATANWEAAWKDLEWSMKGNKDADAKRIMDFEMDADSDPLWTVDRKFLYGFWHDCFAVRQQLFLVFVRTEPMMMGGEGNGNVRPQLGARAMAVVWRDPTPSANRGDGTPAPHQTRVLFYRQFE